MVGDAGGDHLAPARPARHEMRLDQAGDDAQVRVDEAPVDLDRSAARGRPEIDVIGIVAREVVFHPHRGEHPGVADQFLQLRALVGAMQAGGDHHRDLLARHSRSDQALDHRPQEEFVRHRTGDVADQDASALAPLHQLRVGLGGNRALECLADRIVLVRELVQHHLADHRRLGPFREGHRQMATAIHDFDRLVHRNFHLSHSPAIRRRPGRAIPLPLLRCVAQLDSNALVRPSPQIFK